MTHVSFFRKLRGAGIAALCLAVACAAGMAANKKYPGTIENGQFKPTVPPAENFGPNPAFACQEHGVMGSVLDALKNQQVKNKDLKTDGRACAMAETLMGWQGPDNEAPPETVRAFLSQYFGLVKTVEPRGFLLSHYNIDPSKERSDFDKEKEVADGMVGPIVDFASNAIAPRWGMAVARDKGADQVLKWHVVMVMFDEAVQVQPLPRKLPAGGTAKLNATIAPSIKGVKLQVVDTSGKLSKPDVSGSQVAADLSCGDRPGRILVQMSGEKEGGGDVQLAAFAVSCGGELATSVAIPQEDKGPLNQDAAEKKLADSINADRTAAGLKPLNVNPALSEIARNISTAQGQGHALSSGDLQQQMKEKEIQTPMIAESAAQAFGVDDAYSKLSNNPSDRANLLSTEMTTVGVGVAKGADVGGKPTVIVVELFVKESPPADPAQVKAKLYEAINKKRADSRNEPVTKDETLDSVAQKYADEASKYPDGRIPKDKESEIFQPLYANALNVNQLGGWTRDEANALETAEQDIITKPAKLVGVGIAIGKSANFGKNSVYVMVVMGSKAQGAKPAKAAPAKKKKK